MIVFLFNFWEKCVVVLLVSVFVFCMFGLFMLMLVLVIYG